MSSKRMERDFRRLKQRLLDAQPLGTCITPEIEKDLVRVITIWKLQKKYGLNRDLAEAMVKRRGGWQTYRKTWSHVP